MKYFDLLHLVKKLNQQKIMEVSVVRQKARSVKAFRYYTNRMLSQERATLMVMFALMLPVLLGFAALAIDGSNAFLQQQRMQISADAGAMAGIRLMAMGNKTATQVQNEVQSLTILNGADSSTVSYLNSNTEIHVTATRAFDTFFAGLVGLNTMTVVATANAQFSSVSNVGNLLPMTMTCSDMETYTLDVIYILHDTNKLAPGNVGWLTWNGSNSAETLASNIRNPGDSLVLDIGDLIEGVPGNKNSSSVRAALDSLINKTVTMPLYDNITGSGSNVRYRVCGFAQFVLISHNNKTVSGKLVRRVVRGGIGPVGAPDYGSRDVRLTQ